MPEILDEIEIEIERPPAGTACEYCQAEFEHFCPARVYDDRGKPACICCADGVECGARRAVRKLDEQPTPFEDALPVSEVRHIDPASVSVPMDAAPAGNVRSDAELVTARRQAAQLHRDVEKRKKAAPRTRVAQVVVTPKVQKESAVAKAEKKSKECRHPNCSQMTWSKSGVCSQHWFWGNRGEGRLDGGGVPKRKVQGAKPLAKPSEAAPAYADNSGTPVMLRVALTEEQCDALWQQCTPQQKAIGLAAAIRSILVVEA